MKLMNTTNSHANLVKSQLESTDATLVEVYSAGNTDVIFTKAPTHYELLISNKHRAIRETEVEKIREFFLKRKIDLKIIDQSTIKTLYSDKLIEISFPIIQQGYSALLFYCPDDGYDTLFQPPKKKFRYGTSFDFFYLASKPSATASAKFSSTILAQWSQIVAW